MSPSRLMAMLCPLPQETWTAPYLGSVRSVRNLSRFSGRSIYAWDMWCVYIYIQQYIYIYIYTAIYIYIYTWDSALWSLTHLSTIRSGPHSMPFPKTPLAAGPLSDRLREVNLGTTPTWAVGWSGIVCILDVVRGWVANVWYLYI